MEIPQPQLMDQGRQRDSGRSRIEQGERSKFEGSPNLSLYLPLKVRYTAIVVAKGAVFQQPAWW